MVGDNKILTVSYGTFSCTLEGFDDPLGAMRDITEYFRDLSAEDRYFGAEPLTPDPDRVQMIAERRAAAQVESRIAPAGVAAKKAPREDEIADADEVVEPQEPEPAPEPVIEEAARTAPASRPAPAHRTTTASERLARIRAAAGLDLSHGAEAEVEEDALEPEPPEPVMVEPVTAEAEPEPVEPEPFAEPETEPAQPDYAELIARAVAQEPVAPSEPEPRPEPESTHEPEAMHEPETEPEPEVARGPDVEPEPATPAEPEVALGPGAEPGPEATREPEIALDAHSDRPSHGASVFEGAPIDNGNGTADRIFRDTDTALEDSEARRRHSAIAHLKAAVSATVNDRNILGWRKKQSDKEEVAYRADLAQAVKPGKAGEPEEATAPEVSHEPAPTTRFEPGPEAAFGAAPEPSLATAGAAPGPGGAYEDYDEEYELSEPLVLGSDARVDPNSLAALALTEDDRVEAETRPIRPRSSSESFSEFAERTGARGLSELLEAAAGYASQVEGRPQFSRPQIMKHVVTLTEDEYSREDGLRSFGALLRQGKIQKLKRGLFTLSDNSRFADHHRLAGE